MPDPRLDALVKLFAPPKVVPAAIQFVDIAGLGPRRIEGRGARQSVLSHIREVEAILHVVRCFEDPNVVHVENRIDPVADVETIAAELCLKDLETVDKRRERSRKMLKANKPEDRLAVEVCEFSYAHLDKMRPVRSLLAAGSKQGRWPPPMPKILVRELSLLTAKPSLYVANVDEASLAKVSQ